MRLGVERVMGRIGRWENREVGGRIPPHPPHLTPIYLQQETKSCMFNPKKIQNVSEATRGQCRCVGVLVSY